MRVCVGRRFAVVLFSLLAWGACAVLPSAASAQGPLRMYEAVLSPEQYNELAAGGYDIASVDEIADGIAVDLVLTPRQSAELRRKGFDLELIRDRRGRTVVQRAAAQAQGGFDVWRDYDSAGGIEAEIRAFVREHRAIARLHVLGTTHEGREILAVRITQAPGRRAGSKPAVLYQGTAHAREWISTEVTRRLMHWFADEWPRNREVREILRTTELWFVPVVNPDGYQYTFDGERLWRKNLRDNDGDGEITSVDGVDLNRNFPLNWNYDEEGSSSEPSSLTYRGPAPESEPETVANMGLFDRADLRFAISYHSYGPLLLYTQGWQVQTPSADDPIYVALTGTDDDPAVAGFDPGVSADLYTTNGEFTDWAHGDRDVLAWTPELEEGCPGCGFVFPDDEGLVEEQFEKNLDFALRVAQSAPDPANPVSHMGIETEPFYLDVTEIDPEKGGNPQSDLTFDRSHSGGAAQPVDVLAQRDVGDVTVHWRINGGPEQTGPTAPRPDGERFGGNNAYNSYYHYVRGEVTGAAVGDEVEVWFSGGGEVSDSFTYEVTGEPADVLILADEDRTGAVNIPGYASTDPAVPNYLSYYEDAIGATGRTAAVYDVDAEGRTAPSDIGVLGHYGAVVWYMGNNFVTRQAGRGPGNADRLANDIVLEVRSYLNDGGKLLYTGQWAGALFNGLAGTQLYDPVANEVCVEGGQLVLDRCKVISDKDDFLQYYLGAYIYNSDAGTDPETGEPLPIEGTADPYSGLGWELNGADSADNQGHTASFVTTSSLLPPDQYPQFSSFAPAEWVTGFSGPFEPFDGDRYAYSQMANISYKRLARTIDLTEVDAGDAPTLRFRFSYDTEPEWDFVFVEAHTVGEDDWTTLPDENGHTSQNTGDSCPEGWHELHPWLERYQTLSGTECTPTGTTGEWHASAGRSAGWEQWEIDLSDYAGSEVEVSISYASDWAVQGLGAFVDAIDVSTGEGSTSFEDGEPDPMGGWAVPGAPEGSDPNPNDWERTGSVGFEEGAVTATEDSLYFGFGFEGIDSAGTREAVMSRSLGYLLGPGP
ncbi:MAG TPA: M14 family metallopeptidase [Solirubrobacterales bacterium]|nr:M14 family metallopeptidase [Solirubrobacterales bacterium]